VDSVKQTLRRTHRYRLYPTAAQKTALESQLAFACELYNAALEQRQDAWRRQRRSLGYVAQCRDLTDVRADGLGPKLMNCHAMRDPLRRLDRAFNAFFRRLKAGQKPGYPRFRSRRRYDSLTWDSGWSLNKGKLALQGIGHLRVRWHRSLPRGADLRTVTVRRCAKTWHVSFALHRPKPTPLPHTAGAVGLDLGISRSLSCQQVNAFPAPEPFALAIGACGSPSGAFHGGWPARIGSGRLASWSPVFTGTYGTRAGTTRSRLHLGLCSGSNAYM